MNDNRRTTELQRLWVELEWRRAAQDETFFLQEYTYIPSEYDPRGRINFQLFDYQHELLNLFKSNRFVIALKARQLGYTTLAMAHALWLCFFRPGATILVVSRNQKSANKNLAQARLAYQFLPHWMKERAPKLTSDSTDGMTFRFNDGMESKIKSAAAVEGVFAGETATLVILDEAGLVTPASRQEDVFRTLLPTTDAGGSMLIISTSRGAYNRFAKTYRLAKRGDSQFVHFFRPWNVSPFMQCTKDCGWCGGKENQKTPCISKFDAKRREFADEPWRFFQEYPRDDEEAFRESGRPRFIGLPPDSHFTEFTYRGNFEWSSDETIEFVHDENGPLRLNTLDNDQKQMYVIGADPAQGRGADYSAAHIMCLNEDNRPEIIGYYHTNTIEPTEFAADLDKMGRYFQGRQWAALLGVEDQGGQGSLPINELHRHLEYPNAYLHQMPGAKRSRSARYFAFPMTADRKKSVIDRLAKYLVVQDGDLGIDGIYPSLRMELGQFVIQETINGNVKYVADEGCHDDLVLSLAITLWILVEEYVEHSPQSANNEPIQIWGEHKEGTLDLSLVRAEREKAIKAIEEAQQQQWDSILMNTQMYINPWGEDNG
jgi:hypothetical protein